MYQASYPLSFFADFASAETKAKIEVHEALLGQLEIEDATIARAAADLEHLDPMSADLTEINAVVGDIRSRRLTLARRQAAALQERARIIGDLESDRKVAESAAAQPVEVMRNDTRTALAAAGYGHLLVSADLVMRAQMVVFVDSAQPVASAISQVERLRGLMSTLAAEKGQTTRALRTLTEAMQAMVKETVQGELRCSFAAL